MKSKLTLSTLMACLIVGNAGFAEDIVYDMHTYQSGAKGEYAYVAKFINSDETVTADKITFVSENESSYNTSQTAGTGYHALVVTNGANAVLNANEIYVGTAEQGGDRGFRVSDASGGSSLTVHADTFISYTGDEIAHARGGANTINLGTADDRIGYFEAHTTFGKDDYAVALLQANEGSTVNLYADTAILDGSTNIKGGVIGSGGYGTVNVVANNLTIDGNICGTYGTRTDNGKTLSLNVTADNLNMNGKINIGSLETDNSNFNRDTEVNITVTENANITGDINVYGNDSDSTGDDSVLNVDFQNNAVLTGKINVEGNLGTVNLGGNADMTSSSGIYNVTKGGNVNFTGGTWAVNEWTGDDGNMSVGTGAEVILNDNVEVATVTLADGSTTIVDADKVSGTVITATTTNVSDTAAINVNNFDTGSTIKLFSDDSINEKVVANDQISTDNLMQTVTLDENKNLVIGVADASEVLPDVVIGGIITSLTANNIHNDFFDDVLKSGDAAKASEALNSVANMGELAGVNHGTYSMSNAMTDAVAHHLSLATHGEQDKDIWAHYIHNKEDIDGMDFGGVDGSYEAQYNGIVVGSDLYKNGKTTAGIALSYADGNINGSNIASSTKNDAEYYGASLYGRIDNGDSAILGDISYMHSDNDITQNNSGHEITASADADAFSIGIRAEQAYKAGAGKFVPYAGIRYMHLGAGNYDNSLGMSYDADDQNLWLLPVGVTYSAEVQSGDWTVKPIAEVGYVWTMGDRDTDQTVSLNGASDTFGFETADSGSFIGRLGIEAEKADVTYGLSYEYQKGDTVKANKWMANLTFSF